MASSVISGRYNEVFWMQACGPSPRGLVLAPPLIGGHALMQFRMLRPLVRRGFDLLSFNYTGHGLSRGRFTFQAALDNTRDILDLALERCRAQDLPLYGLASCFAAIPLLHAIGLGRPPMAGLVLVNAVPHLRGERLVVEFLRHWHRRRPDRSVLSGMGAALRAYRDELFPDIAHQERGFGILTRHRIRWPRMISELITLRHINRQPLPIMPVLCVYGRHDLLLQQMGFADWLRYESLVARLCPQAEFRPVDGDHFLSDPAVRLQLTDAVFKFLLNHNFLSRKDCRG